MTTEMRDRLRQLADEAGATHGPPAGDLWERGRRYQRRRRTGTLAISVAAIVALVALLGTSWQRAAPPPEPMPADAPVGIPDRLFQPSPWLPDTAEDGPLGRLAVVQDYVEQGGWGADVAPIGISASTGEYRFLELPDRSDIEQLALAPDGRHVAYWVTGETNGTPNTRDGAAPVAGIAVYDAETGEVRRHAIATEHGLMADTLAWIDGDSLILDFGQFVGGDDDSEMDQSSGRNAPALLWDLEDDRPVPWGLDAQEDFYLPGASVSGRRLAVGDEQYRMLGAAAPGPATIVDSLPVQDPAPDPTGTRLAGVSGAGGRTPNHVTVGTIPVRDADASYERVPGDRQYLEVLGWTGDQQVAALRRIDKRPTVAVVEVDVETGEWSRLVRIPRETSGGAYQWATDLWLEPTVSAEAPPTPMDPRITAGLLVMTVALAFTALLWWRRRVEP